MIGYAGRSLERERKELWRERQSELAIVSEDIEARSGAGSLVFEQADEREEGAADLVVATLAQSMGLPDGPVQKVRNRQYANLLVTMLTDVQAASLRDELFLAWKVYSRLRAICPTFFPPAENVQKAVHLLNKKFSVNALPASVLPEAAVCDDMLGLLRQLWRSGNPMLMNIVRGYCRMKGSGDGAELFKKGVGGMFFAVLSGLDCANVHRDINMVAIGAAHCAENADTSSKVLGGINKTGF